MKARNGAERGVGSGRRTTETNRQQENVNAAELHPLIFTRDEITKAGMMVWGSNDCAPAKYITVLLLPFGGYVFSFLYH